MLTASHIAAIAVAAPASAGAPQYSYTIACDVEDGSVSQSAFPVTSKEFREILWNFQSNVRCIKGTTEYTLTKLP